MSPIAIFSLAGVHKAVMRMTRPRAAGVAAVAAGIRKTRKNLVADCD